MTPRKSAPSTKSHPSNTPHEREPTYGLINNWILPQIDSRFDEEPELRNKLFTIYIYGLLDACHGTDSRIVDIKRRATKLNAKGALHYLNVLRTYVDSILDICGIFSRGEMLVIGELRTQNVHGHGRNTAKTDISGSSKITP
jgi:hypothetical protein